MTVIDTTEKSQSATISLEFNLPHPPGKVWRALTEAELLAEWLLPAVNINLERGASFMFKTVPVGGWDGIVHCRVAEIETGKKLSYDWGVGDMATVVTFTLEPTATGTRLLLVHSGFTPEQKNNFGGARYGWKMMGGKLVNLLTRTQ
jgi:uncharacterized protein YndB with AHSA1/START domain